MKVWSLGILLLSFSVVGVHPATAEAPDHLTCFECHADLEDLLEKPDVHAPFGMQECTECHNPHAAQHAMLLRADTRDLCAECHDDVSEELTRPHLHRPAADGECAKCHEPHASDNASLLKASPAELCSQCHAQVAEWEDMEVMHPPVEDSCANCHQPHGSTEEHLLVDAAKQICTNCHDASDVAAAHPIKGIVGTDCTACHDPHASNKASLLRSNEHVPFAEQKCSLCHSNPQPDAPFVVTDVKVVCQRCHAEAREFGNFAFHHILDRDNSCIQCHNPHTSNASHLLKAEETRLCTTCHFVNDRGTDSKSLTHPGVECGECHMPHGADNDRYLKAGGNPELCLSCHDREAHASHPVGEKIIDPRTKRPVTCLSCHKLHGARYPKYLPLNPDRELCIQCHRK